jgi:antitoxin VapB
VLRQVPTSAAAVFDLLSSLPEDFMAEGRQDTPPQEREAF